MKLTTDKALIFSAVMITAFSIVMIIIFCIYQTVPDSLIISFFGAFTFEGGFCSLIYKIKKDAKIRMGDITGFDDAEVIDDAPDQNELVFDFDYDDREIDDGK